MPDYPQEGALRGGHIPGAANVPWARAVREDATFKSADELKEIYEGEAGLNQGDDVIAYCRIGERSDRKSTRLNSSHANISYAVFCLKKKKKKTKFAIIHKIVH